MENETTQYAGFWMRFVAYILDSFIISFIEVIVVLPILGFFGFKVITIGTLSDLENTDPDIMIPLVASAISAIALSAFLITWLYYALLQSSSRQATIGKMVLNLEVVDAYGERISFATASLRYFAKILSSLFMMIGYIMAAFTYQNQALHDMIAKTYVVQK